MKIKLRGPSGLRYYYPDLAVVCDEDTAETRPCLIVEILSGSTRQVGMTFKARDYLSLPSLQGYLLVDSEGRAAQLYRRLLGGGWTTEIMQDGLIRIPLSSATSGNTPAVAPHRRTRMFFPLASARKSS